MVDMESAEKYGLKGGDMDVVQHEAPQPEAAADKEEVVAAGGDGHAAANTNSNGYNQPDRQQIVHQYQQANDDDTMQIMDIMSSKNQQELNQLFFYCVPSSWFQKAYVPLTDRSQDFGENWLEGIGSIPTYDLVDGGMSQLKSGLQHEKDFYLVGPKAWDLLEHVFAVDADDAGTCHVLKRPCVFLSDSSNQIAVRLYDAAHEKTLEIIPPNARFGYESKLRDSSPTDVSMVNSQDSLITSITLIPDDNENRDAKTPWDPVIEDTDSASGPANPGPEKEPVLRLPPSTAAIAQAAAAAASAKNLESGSADDMDAESTRSQSTSGKAPSKMAGRKRFASGLGNLGNTCFMNSTVQCLAHTEPLRRYFLSGEYEFELNRDNPLGTGGELATQFAKLMADMWCSPSKRRNVMGTSYDYSYSNNAAVYPRRFKETLGKHAEQFMGYDQHDSQELATYLLDALHEDTNRVTKKPYVEKPEQGEDEPDDVAAAKAWNLHLRREDSKVLENFMGQVKSRVQCCKEDCNRVSTTFDPFMYLSVPIPGSDKRTMKITFVPRDGKLKICKLSIEVGKTAAFSAVAKKVVGEVISRGICDDTLQAENLAFAEIYHCRVYKFIPHTKEVDTVPDTDDIFAYEVDSVENARKEFEEHKKASKAKADDSEEDSQVTKWKNQGARQRTYKLDLATMRTLAINDEWQSALGKYIMSPTVLANHLNPKRAKALTQVRFHQSMEKFIIRCIKEVKAYEDNERAKPKRSRQVEEEDDDQPLEANSNDDPPSDEKLDCLFDTCNTSALFYRVESRHDIAVMEYCSNKFRQYIIKTLEDEGNEHKDGVVVQLSINKKTVSTYASRYEAKTFPLLMRVPSNMTVFGFRKAVSERLERCLSERRLTDAEDGEALPAESVAAQREGNLFNESPALTLIRKVPMTFTRVNIASSFHSSSPAKPLGMLKTEDDALHSMNGNSFAVPTDPKEQEVICEVVGEKGAIALEFSTDFFDDHFDLASYEAEEENTTPMENGGAQAPIKNKKVTVQDCIQKYCQMEQLEDTEMWYCNRCKEHVRAWKQFHLYRAPPILIIHLKRFHFSATTHRRNKITTLIDFPLEGLDLTDMFSRWNENEKPIYDCYAVSNHYGGLGGGHYTAYTLGEDGTWCHYDDSRLTQSISENEVVSTAAYVLYYRRRDVPVGQDLIVESPILNHADSTPTDACEVSSNHTDRAPSDDIRMDDRSASSQQTLSSQMVSVAGANEDTFGQEDTDDEFALGQPPENSSAEPLPQQ